MAAHVLRPRLYWVDVAYPLRVTDFTVFHLAPAAAW